jgi:flagellar basal body rod protein FlgB
MKDAEDTILLLTENIAKIHKPSKHQRELEFQDSQSLAPRKNSTGTTTATTETRSSSIYQKHGLGVAGFRANSYVNLAEEDKENVRNEQKE